MNIMLEQKKGKLISLEGLDGSGKSTQIKLLKSHFESMGEKVVLFKFPSLNSPITDLFYRKETFYTKKFTNTTIQLLCMADIVNTFEQEILPLLNDNVNVLLDRFVFSNYLHYTIENPVGKDFVNGLLNLSILDHLTANIWFNISPEQASKNLDTHGDRKEYESLVNLKRQKDAFFEFIGASLHENSNTMFEKTTIIQTLNELNNEMLPMDIIHQDIIHKLNL
jgi:dTMP kinase